MTRLLLRFLIAAFVWLVLGYEGASLLPYGCDTGKEPMSRAE